MELTQIPKIELHLHLDGAVPPETMWRMAQEKGLALPADTLEDFRTRKTKRNRQRKPFWTFLKRSTGRSWSRFWRKKATLPTQETRISSSHGERQRKDVEQQ